MKKTKKQTAKESAAPIITVSNCSFSNNAEGLSGQIDAIAQIGRALEENAKAASLLAQALNSPLSAALIINQPKG